MHKIELRLVATRLIDKFKNIYYDYGLKKVYYGDDGLPTDMCEMWEPNYICNKSLKDFNTEIDKKIIQYFREDIIDEIENKLSDYIGDMRSASLLPILIHPDDFKIREKDEQI